MKETVRPVSKEDVGKQTGAEEEALLPEVERGRISAGAYLKNDRAF